ncbi:MAG: type II secretion system F family protein [Pseudomonadota bacterium]
MFESVMKFFRPSVKRRNIARRRHRGLWAWLSVKGDQYAFSWSIRESLYIHLATQNGNGIPMEKALDNFRTRLVRNKRVSSEKIISEVSRRMRDGATLAVAISKWIPRDETAIISSGELSGNLPRALELIVESKRSMARISRAATRAAITPSVYGLAVAGVVWTIGRHVVPDLKLALPMNRAEGFAYALYVAGDFLNTYWALLPPLTLIAAVLLIRWSLPRWTGARRIAAERYFPFSYYRDTQGFAWLMGFTALLRAGVSDVDILERQSKEWANSPWMRERLRALWWRVNNGASFSDALLARGANGLPAFGFPNPDVVDYISSLAGFSDSPDRIAKVATDWAQQMEESMVDGAVYWGLGMELVMYMVMFFLMLAVNSLSAAVGTNPGF